MACKRKRCLHVFCRQFLIQPHLFTHAAAPTRIYYTFKSREIYRPSCPWSAGVLSLSRLFLSVQEDTGGSFQQLAPIILLCVQTLADREMVCSLYNMLLFHMNNSTYTLILHLCASYMLSLSLSPSFCLFFSFPPSVLPAFSLPK